MPFRGPTDEFSKRLGSDPRIELVWVKPDEFDGNACVIVLPGSGRTLDDLAALRQSGGAEAIRRHLSAGGIVVGVCGGYQILGHKLYDPYLAQGSVLEADGLGLLPISTVFGPKMLNCQTEARLLVGSGSGGTIVGEERRSGYSFCAGSQEGFVRLSEVRKRRMHERCPRKRILKSGLAWAPGHERLDGHVCADGKVWGSYLHLLLESEAFLTTLLALLD